jgi:integrase
LRAARQTKNSSYFGIKWQYVIEAAEQMAKQDGNQHQRTLFIISILYSLYLRISELVATKRWTPKMNDFAKDNDGNWWFTTVGKGNKQRQISVSDATINALKRWRKHLKLSPTLPTPNDNSPLIPKLRNNIEPISDPRHVRRIVQSCFDEAIYNLCEDGFKEDAAALSQATVHWLRHTGISDDVKIRPREHVRDDAGHSSSSITDKYIDIELRERHATAKKKLINKDLKEIDNRNEPRD